MGFFATFAVLVLVALVVGVVAVVRSRRFWSAAAVYLIAFLIPVGFVWADCLESRISEACVWGQSFMPLYWGASVIGGTAVFLGMLGVIWMVRRMRSLRA